MHELALRVGQLASLEVQRIIGGAEATLRAIAKAPVISRVENPGCNEYLAALKAELPHFVDLSLIAKDGAVLCRSGPGAGTGLSSFVEQAIKERSIVLGSYVDRGKDNAAILPMAVPLTNDAGYLGILLGTIDLRWLGLLLKERNFPLNSALTIADRSGRIIAREPFPDRFVGTRIPDAFQHLLKEEKPNTLELTSQDGTRRIMGYYPPSSDPNGLYVSAGFSREEAFREINQASLRSVLIMLASVILGIGGAWLIAQSLVTRPVNRILQTIRAWRNGNAGARSRMKYGTGELAQLGVAVDRFLAELEQQKIEASRNEQLRRLLVSELEHRVKNTLATIQAIATQTFGRGRSINEELSAFTGRLQAMGHMHELLVAEDWKAADIHEIVERSVQNFQDGNGAVIRFQGPMLSFRAKAALALSLALHELCTNAAKYGALSAAGGQIEITWRIDRSTGTPRFCFEWTETGGPPVRAPRRRGFGTLMIERALAAELNADVHINYAKTGLICQIEANVSDLTETDDLPREADMPVI